jgi:Xaa-Pro dipeptidase
MNRHERLRQLMKVRGVDAVVIRRPANFAWYTGGADTKVDHVASEGVADLVVWADAELVLTNTIEAPRMRAEQVPGFEVVEYAWHEDRLAALREVVGGACVGDHLLERLGASAAPPVPTRKPEEVLA